MSELQPADYAATLQDLTARVCSARSAIQRQANSALLELYWQIGATLIDRQRSEAWGSGTVERLAMDLRAEFPTMTGFSRANLFAMRRFAEAWPDPDSVVRQPVGQLPWGHVLRLLQRLDDQTARDWYAARDVEHGWSRAILEHQIRTDLRGRSGGAASNFTAVLEPGDASLAQDITKDPYTLDFLALGGDITERALEQRLTDRIVDTLRELGAGFAFVGRQVHLEVDEQDFYLDLLFFHVEQLRYVVIELKITSFDPRDVGQLGFYVAAVDDRLRIPDRHAPTLGVLLVADKSETVVRYALAGTSQPIAVARYQLSAAEQASLPTEDALRAVAAEVTDLNAMD